MKIKTIIAAVAVAAVALFAASCTKSNSASPLKNELIGTWEGEVVTGSMTYNDQKIETKEKVTLVFTDKKLTITRGDESPVEYGYVIGDGGSKGYYFTASSNGEAIGSAYYTVSGNTLNITAGDGTFFLSLPKTLTKK